MEYSTTEIIKWINRMTDKYGCSVWEKDTGKNWDWGQALCRERFGADWMNSAAFKKAKEDGPFMEDVIVAKKWEAGEWPEWVDMEAMGLVVDALGEGER